MDITKDIQKLELLFTQIQTDPTLMLIVAISVSLTLLIILIITIFSSTIQTLRNTLFNEREFSKVKVVEVNKLTREIKVYDKTKTEAEKELKKFEELKLILIDRDKEIKELKNKLNNKKTRIDTLEFDLNDVSDKYQKSLTEIKGVKKRNEELISDRKRK